ncbi:MAG: nucleoside hydrolase [Gammaproteobacteria bacterium]|nr:nucleoside hydrolase [Gammaproteobacteria bacterium]
MLAAGFGTAALGIGRAGLPGLPARQRIIIDNDLAGDPDGLFQTAHHLLSPSVDVRLIVGSHLHEHEFWAPDGAQASASAAKARELLGIMGWSGRVPVQAGAERALPATGLPARTPAADAIIAEVLRGADDTPLYYTAGAGLTDLATAWLLEPRIGRRVRLIWIGGPEYPGASAPPGPREAEYNLTIDLRATQLIFGQSDIDIWQVPRSTYRQMLVGYAELVARVRAAGPIGDYLVRQLENVIRVAAQAPPPYRINPGDTYVLGDSPLVTLTALQAPFQPDPSSCVYELRRRPTIDAHGNYGKPAVGRPIRVYTRIDTRLTFEDLYAKLVAAGNARMAMRSMDRPQPPVANGSSHDGRHVDGP